MYTLSFQKTTIPPRKEREKKPSQAFISFSITKREKQTGINILSMGKEKIASCTESQQDGLLDSATRNAARK